MRNAGLSGKQRDQLFSLPQWEKWAGEQTAGVGDVVFGHALANKRSRSYWTLT